MSVNHAQLMRYYDGELSSEEAARVEAALAADPEARRVLDGLTQLSAFVRVHQEQQLASGEGLADAIMARVLREEPAAKAGPELGSEVRRGPWKNVVPAAAAVLALAASVALVNELAENSDVTTPVGVQPPVASEQPQAAAAPVEEPAVEQVFAETDPSVAIETVDFGAREGTIFLMQEGEESTPVVWLMDEPAPAGGRMEPL